MNLRNFPIAGRLTAAFAALVLIVVLVGALALKSMGTMRTEATVVEEVWVPELQLIVDLNQEFLLLRLTTLRLLLAQDPQEFATLQTRLNELSGLLDRAESNFIEKSSDPAIARLFARYQTARGDYVRTQVEVIRLAGIGQGEEAMALVRQRLDALGGGVLNTLLELEDGVIEALHRAAEASFEAYESGFRAVVIFLIVASLVAAALAFTITRSIVGPIRQAMELSGVVASGDLTQRITVTGKDEPARLLRSLAAMQDQLRETIQGISSSSTQLASAAEELNAVTEDATRGLQRQNDEIQQAATAVNEMSTAVDEVAGNAVSTSEQSKMTASIAAEGQSQVASTVTSIDKLTVTITSTSAEVQDLADKAQNISRVLDVIRAIAEQTNLLALNAAIEAARAGEQGRGFAVVADEVRALAHRTQQSTSEIEEMIANIQHGTEKAVAAMQVSRTMASSTLEQADAAGQALARINSAIGEINERNLVIASASEEQASVAREVDRNLVNIRDLSTQSAAGAEQTSSSSRELSRLAVQLNELVQRFRT